MLTFTCDVERPVAAKNAYNEKTATYSSVGTDVPCYPGNPHGRQMQDILAMGLDPSKTKLFFFAYDADIVERDRITFDGRQYQVKAINKQGPAVHHIEVVAETPFGG
jgi:hypothetical protein